jgi:hypothetical protein
MLRAWRELPQERRLAALASAGLFLTLFLPWYQETVFANGVTSLRSASSSLTGWGAFSFVEAAVMLVAAAVLILLFVRAEGQAFHVPGGDGGVITAAGIWTCVLIVWRIFDKEGTSRHDQIAYTSGIEWGIFVALGVAAVLTYAGSQIRLAHEPEPPLPGEPTPQRRGRRKRSRGWLRKGSDDARRRSTAPRAYPGPDMGAEDDWTQEVRARRAAPPSEAPTRREWSQPPADSSEAPTQRVRPRSIAGPDEPHDPTATVSAHRTRPLDRREIQELEIAEPPTARLGRSAPAGPRRPEPAPAPDDEPDQSEAETLRQHEPAPPADADDDQLTIRLDRPN